MSSDFKRNDQLNFTITRQNIVFLLLYAVNNRNGEVGMEKILKFSNYFTVEIILFVPAQTHHQIHRHFFVLVSIDIRNISYRRNYKTI